MIQRIIVVMLVVWMSTVFAQVQAVVTVGFIADMVRNVGGARVQVSVIAPANADPHSFEPKPSTLISVSKAQVIFANGLMLEPFLNKIRAQASKNTPVILLGDKQSRLMKATEGGNTKTFDPHLWLDPSYGIGYVETIKEALAQLDPAGKNIYQANAKNYVLEIQKADQAVVDCLKAIPPKTRKIVAQHEALSYFARHYQITLVGAISDFAGQEKGPKSLALLAKAMKDQGIRVLFAEPQFSQAEAKALAEATGAKVGLIYSDAFDNEVNTYLKLLQANGRAVCGSFR